MAGRVRCKSAHLSVWQVAEDSAALGSAPLMVRELVQPVPLDRGYPAELGAQASVQQRGVCSQP